MTQVTLHQERYLVDSGDFFSGAETRELVNLLRGLTYDEAAARSRTSIETVKSHRQAIRAKTGQHNCIGVLTYCLVYGYIRPVDLNSPALHRRHKLMVALRAANDRTHGGLSYG